MIEYTKRLILGLDAPTADMALVNEQRCVTIDRRRDTSFGVKAP
jgi:hypothetical protein